MSNKDDYSLVTKASDRESEKDSTSSSNKGQEGFNQSSSDKPWGMELNVFCMLMHLSMLLNFIIPFAGLVLPIVMWATNKEQHKEIDIHGRNIFNWMLSSFIYFVICGILIFVIIGAFLMMILGVVSVIFTIIAAVKANDGVYWKYPLSFDFFGFNRLNS